ncbi:MAG: T9SS type A sorting domain-containing protein, partial [Ignavibacteriales bacterium]|nr:T9SS type A sorting domain-containing protein [Ignavibacteriales bacterium]
RKYSYAGAPGYPILDMTFQVSAGWNLIGTISKPVATSNIVKSPGLTIGDFYKYSEGYSVATTITAGRGYWVKVNQSGTLRLIASESIPKIAEIDYSSLNKLVISDNSGWTQTLYIDSEEKLMAANLDESELPPAAPYFDARFKNTGSMVAKYPDTLKENAIYEYPITIFSEAYPIKINWEITEPPDKSLSLKSNGKTLCVMEGRGSISLKNTTGLAVTLGNQDNLPKEFALEQNYPNPFNSSTIIRYQIPFSCWVTLKLYNVLGQEVTTLVDEMQEAGYKSVEWDASGVSSGIYFYKLTAGNYISIKKMILIR